jgi:hypothetical protein
MEELVKLVSKKTGLSEALAQVAVRVVVDYLKKKLPAPVGAQIDLFLKNEAKVKAAAGAVEGLLGAAKKAAAKKPAAKASKKK